jgi:hypothetical protein
MYRLSWNLGSSTSWNPQGLSRPALGLLYLFRTSLQCQGQNKRNFTAVPHMRLSAIHRYMMPFHNSQVMTRHWHKAHRTAVLLVFPFKRHTSMTCRDVTRTSSSFDDPCGRASRPGRCSETLGFQLLSEVLLPILSLQWAVQNRNREEQTRSKKSSSFVQTSNSTKHQVRINNI